MNRRWEPVASCSPRSLQGNRCDEGPNALYQFWNKRLWIQLSAWRPQYLRGKNEFKQIGTNALALGAACAPTRHEISSGEDGGGYLALPLFENEDATRMHIATLVLIVVVAEDHHGFLNGHGLFLAGLAFEVENKSFAADAAAGVRVKLLVVTNDPHPVILHR